MSKKGRPSKRTPEIDKVIEEALRLGSTRRAACACAGISEDTFAIWLKRYSDFSDLVNRVEGEVERRMAATIIKAANDGDYRAALEWLKRRRPADWGDVSKHEHTGPDGGAIQLQFADQLDRIYGKGGSGGG